MIFSLVSLTERGVWRVGFWMVTLAVAGGVAAAQPVANTQVIPTEQTGTTNQDSVTALDQFLTDLRTWETDFTQTVTDARGRTQASQRGKLWVERPGRFRWQIGAPDPVQVMVADGLNLWFFDRDLEQVTVRAARDSMSATPASLLAGTIPLRDGFLLETQPRRAGLNWVRVTPKKSDAEFREARLGFSGSMLKKMELADKLGQSVTLDFSQSSRNQGIPSGVLTFDVPAGADLIGTPLRP